MPDTKEKSDLLAKELVQQALTKIPYEYRSALVLKEIEGLSYQEIAEALTIPVNTVETKTYFRRNFPSMLPCPSSVIIIEDISFLK